MKDEGRKQNTEETIQKLSFLSSVYSSLCSSVFICVYLWLILLFSVASVCSVVNNRRWKSKGPLE